MPLAVPTNPMQVPLQYSIPNQYPFMPLSMDQSLLLTQSGPTVFQVPVESRPDITDAPSNTANDTPKKRSRTPSKRNTRKVRPKVIPEKGAIQCKGTNRKKNKRCRNAALMEFIGPRPIYCAEHIHLDPECLYTKCKSVYQKVPGDKKVVEKLY